MLTSDLLTADEAAKLLRIGRRTFDAHVARGDIAYIAVGMGLKRTRKRFDPEDLAQFRERQRRVECLPEPILSRPKATEPQPGSIDFAAILRERRAEKRAAREKERQPYAARRAQNATAHPKATAIAGATMKATI